MRKIVFFLFLITTLSNANDGEWSKTGHRTVGEVAQHHLSKKAKKALKKLLNGESLAHVSTFADEIKADRAYKEFSAWHYVNIPEGKDYADIEPSEHGDLIIGINKCIEIIKDENSKKEDKVFYLKMLVHLIGDLHQPMHVGRFEDKGGNDIQLQWFNQGTNLHRVWDSNMIDDYGMSYTELASNLPEVSTEQVEAIQEGDIYDWVEESQEIANKLYDSVEMGEKLYYRYSYNWWGTVETQLQKGGLRLAKVLNELF
ncbi:S1/P1 nuclease [Zobellia alginiliquefaciens]|uniref:S1/P1 nuclease n=1 Tax=Zobellia alginiliquefaciens TaxID=3032586 RepID=UPI0023E433B7|nr:S1/P1 nuclease [Zobellia alginiliquefaciens]